MGTMLARFGRLLRGAYGFFAPARPPAPARPTGSAEFAREAESQRMRSTFTGG